jgi:hypothetical protein
MSTPRRVHHAATRVLSLLMVAIGIALVVATVAVGGGPLARGVLLGAVFVLAGCARLYLQARTRNG